MSLSRLLVHVALGLDTAAMRLVERRLQEAELDVAFLRTRDEFDQHLPRVRFLLADPMPRMDWSRARALELIHGSGAGVDPLFPAEGLDPRVHVANCRGAHADAVRDHAFALLLAFARDLPRAFEQQRSKSFRGYPSVPLRDKTLCLVGFGQVGRRIAETARAFGMRVHAVRRSGAADALLESACGPDDILAAVAFADYTVVCAPLTSASRGLVNARVIDALPYQGVFVNVARGALVDHGALEAALRTGRLRGAGLDVFSDEPLPPASTLWSCPRLVITPHVAGHTPDYLDPVLDRFAENVARVAAGGPPADAVSRELEY